MANFCQGCGGGWNGGKGNQNYQQQQATWDSNQAPWTKPKRSLSRKQRAEKNYWNYQQYAQDPRLLPGQETQKGGGKGKKQKGQGAKGKMFNTIPGQEVKEASGSDQCWDAGEQASSSTFAPVGAEPFNQVALSQHMERFQQECARQGKLIPEVVLSYFKNTFEEKPLNVQLHQQALRLKKASAHTKMLEHHLKVQEDAWEAFKENIHTQYEAECSLREKKSSIIIGQLDKARIEEQDAKQQAQKITEELLKTGNTEVKTEVEEIVDEDMSQGSEELLRDGADGYATATVTASASIPSIPTTPQERLRSLSAARSPSISGKDKDQRGTPSRISKSVLMPRFLKTGHPEAAMQRAANAIVKQQQEASPPSPSQQGQGAPSEPTEPARPMRAEAQVFRPTEEDSEIP
jgi:hypothetical protein